MKTGDRVHIRHTISQRYPKGLRGTISSVWKDRNGDPVMNVIFDNANVFIHVFHDSSLNNNIEIISNRPLL